MAVSVILVVEDEATYREVLSAALAKEGFAVVSAEDGVTALQLFEQHSPALVILDLMIPRLSGIDVCRRLRQRSDVPIIMVTAKTSEIDVVVGLEVGADDYVTKPYRLRELLARVRANLRRAGFDGDGPVGDDSDALVIGPVQLDLARHELRVRGEAVDLPPKEFDLLELLMENAGRALTRGRLMQRVWGADYVGDTKTLDVHVKRLRQKIEDDPAQPTRLVTLRGVGYRYEVDS